MNILYMVVGIGLITSLTEEAVVPNSRESTVVNSTTGGVVQAVSFINTTSGQVVEGAAGVAHSTSLNGNTMNCCKKRRSRVIILYQLPARYMNGTLVPLTTVKPPVPPPAG